MQVPAWQWQRLALMGLEEDIGSGDLTTEAVLSAKDMGGMFLVAREKIVVAGMDAVQTVYRLLDSRVSMVPAIPDGSVIEAGVVVATLQGPSRSLLTGERVALNILQRLSGIATITRQVIEEVADLPVAILDTRKTTPGWRVFEKYAVRCGGGKNHRFGLYDAVLIKDNHIAAAGSVANAIRTVRSHVGPLVPIEIEIDSLSQIGDALQAKPHALLLDNMTPASLQEAVRIVDHKVWLEASGNIQPNAVRQIAQTGVDAISLGWLTHSARSVDIGADWGNGL